MPSYKIEGVDDLQKVFRKLRGTEGQSVFTRAIDAVTVLILGESQQNLRKNGSPTTNKLLNSGRVVSAKFGGNEAEGAVNYNSNYAWYVEFGRRAGKMPPIDDIWQWGKKKGLSITRSAAYLIARSIGSKGTEAKPFLLPAFEGKKDVLISYIKTLYTEYINGISR